MSVMDNSPQKKRRIEIETVKASAFNETPSANVGSAFPAPSLIEMSQPLGYENQSSTSCKESFSPNDGMTRTGEMIISSRLCEESGGQCNSSNVTARKDHRQGKDLRPSRSPVLCDICHVHTSRYNFKCCQWKCCSLDCYKRHQVESLPVTETLNKDVRKNSTVEFSPQNHDDISISSASKELLPDCSLSSIKIEDINNIPTHLQAPCGGPRRLTDEEIRIARMTRKAERLGRHLHQLEESDPLEDEDGVVLNNDQKKRLESNPKLTKWFDSLPIRRTVRAINTSKQRIDRLAQYMLNEEFSEFIHDLMDTLSDDNNLEENDADESLLG